MPPTVSVRPLSTGRHKLAIQGQFTHPHWFVFLFQGLAERQVSVESGWARSGKVNYWSSELVLDFRRAAVSPEAINYVELALQKRPAPEQVEPPRLSQFSVARSADESLELRIEGPDQVGFLARLLRRVSGTMLLPTAIEIATDGGRIRDCFVLRGPTGGPPDEGDRQALESLLESLTADS